MIKIENHVKRENKLEGNVKNMYVMTFKGFWETYRESCASRFISESWDWSEDLVEVELLYRYDSILWVG